MQLNRTMGTRTQIFAGIFYFSTKVRPKKFKNLRCPIFSRDESAPRWYSGNKSAPRLTSILLAKVRRKIRNSKTYMWRARISGNESAPRYKMKGYANLDVDADSSNCSKIHSIADQRTTCMSRPLLKAVPSHQPFLKWKKMSPWLPLFLWQFHSTFCSTRVSLEWQRFHSMDRGFYFDNSNQRL